MRNPQDNSTLYYIDETPLATDKDYMTYYPWIIDGCLASILPFILLLVLNARLIMEVRKSTQYLQVILALLAHVGAVLIQALSKCEKIVEMGKEFNFFKTLLIKP